MVNIFKQKPFLFSWLVLMLLIGLHSTGSYYSLYWRFFWFDIVVHIVSGLWVGLIFLWLASVCGQINSMREYKVKSLLVALISAVLIGVVWELLENITQITFVKASGYGFNTALDILNDGLGGILACIYFLRRKKVLDTSVEVIHPFYSQTGLIKV